MGKRISVLGVPFDIITMEQTIEQILTFMQGNECKSVYTPNPEMIMTAREDQEFAEVLQNGDLVIPDGIGVVIASRLGKNPLPERVAGYDTVQNLFQRMKDTSFTVYFLGAAPGIAEEAAQKMKAKYPGLQIVGWHHGYFTKEDEPAILKEINETKPDLLLVGLGFPRQEKWIAVHQKQLPVKVCIGVGGSFDGMSGKVKRAPVFFQKIGLEWFYRLLRQPTRWRRMLQLPVFLWHVAKENHGR